MLSVLFIIAATTTLLFTSFFPLQLLFPLLAIVALRVSHLKALWISALCGLFLDVFSAQTAFGTHAIALCLVMLILFPYRRYFFEEKWLPFTLYALLFSSLSSLFLAFAASFTNQGFSWSFRFVVTDLFFLPFCDAICGYFLLILPKLIVRFFKRTLLQWRWRSS